MATIEEHNKLSEKIIELEKTRKEAQDELKVLKEEYLSNILENDFPSVFESPNGMIFLDSTVSYKIADGLKEETEVKSKSPEKLSQDFVEEFFTPDLKLSKRAKKAIKEDDTELLSVLVPEEKTKLKIVLA